MVHVEPLSHHETSVAAKIHAVLRLAYTQEAALLQVKQFAPLDRTAEQIRTSTEYFIGAIEDDEIIGVLSLAPDDEPNQLNISSLVVHPECQRRGIGRMLLAEALGRGSGMVFSVSTGLKNAPALALYETFGFIAYRHGTIGKEALELVKLRRSAP